MGTANITPFGTTAAGQPVDRVVLRSDQLTVAILTWGAVVQDLRLSGVAHSLTLGSDNMTNYEGEMRHHGSLIGPMVNRISNARVTIEGMTYELERNQDGRIHLHSGAQATHLQVWDIVAATDRSVTLQIKLGDGDCGLPGNRVIDATFTVDGAALDLRISGTTDAKTPMNFANHSYWNLDGSARWDGHKLQVLADRYLPGTPDNYPTGEIVEVAGTAMDFNALRALNSRDHAFDNNFCLSDAPTDLREVLTLQGASGVTLQVATDQPGIQIYDARDARRPGRDTYEGLAIEAQFWPDAPNNPRFPSIMVGPDHPYRQHTQFRFSDRGTISP